MAADDGDLTGQLKNAATSSAVGRRPRRLLRVCNCACVCLVFAVLLVGVVLGLTLGRPADRGGPYDARFSALNVWHARALAEAGQVRDANATRHAAVRGDGSAFLDLDVFAKNAERASAAAWRAVGDGSAATTAASSSSTPLRLVAKSLPALDVLAHAMRVASTDRLMVFHASMLTAVVERFSQSPPDVLLGVPLSAPAAAAFLAESRPSPEALARITFLVDTPERARGYAAVARAHAIQLRVAVEIDIGLHRGGAVNPNAAVEILDVLADATDALAFGGFMGYDGHCQGSPYAAFVGKDKAMSWCVEMSLMSFSAFKEAGVAAHPSLFDQPGLIFNGGGSTTLELLARYGEASSSDATMPLNEVSAGSALVMPGDFDLPTLANYTPALFLGGPVIRELAPTRNPVPFIPDLLWSALRWYDPNLYRAVYVEGSSMPTSPLCNPPGLGPNPLLAQGGPSGLNVFPTQSLVQLSASTPLAIGDLVFRRPSQGDAILGFTHLVGLQGLSTDNANGAANATLFPTFSGI